MFAELRRRELRIACSFKECGGLCMVEIEDLFDATATALVDKTFESDEHPRYTLRQRIKWAALKLHRDRARHSRILKHAAPTIELARREAASAEDPERSYIAREQRHFAHEFLAQL
jgi:hypothetical protein